MHAQQGTVTSLETEVVSSSSSGWSGFAWRCAGTTWVNMCSAWQCFDRVAGRLLGLDVPKYQWAILEHDIRMQEEEEFLANNGLQRKQDASLDAMESATTAPDCQDMGGVRKPRSSFDDFKDVPLSPE